MIKDSDNTILLIEDEYNLGMTLQEYLKENGHNCYWAKTIKDAQSLFKEIAPEIVLMDIGLPDGNGIELAKKWRENNQHDFVLLFLSAQNDPETKLTGLELGAEDYITKPFALKELMLRLNRIKRHGRLEKKELEHLKFGKLKIWFNRFELQDAAGNILSLSQKECAILKLLYDKKNEPVNRDKIIESVWGKDSYPSNRTVDNYIVKLRRWAETDPNSALTIISVRGVGYKLSICKKD